MKKHVLAALVIFAFNVTFTKSTTNIERVENPDESVTIATTVTE